MNCPNCNMETLKNGKYICKSDGYHIADSDGNVVMLVRPDTIENNAEEIDTTSDVEYCSNAEPGLNFCNYWRFK